ncbi:bifunctional nuclease family protein [Collinsella tanakaei]|uniref:bifunctional nuclease family protein n=1 Tax=Collinsella tanakaei TaxID=626935 RepID=UPI001F26615C|nr:bifunctional nuclease family protein [Collinsella tanakaei]MCF2621860.1 bifunctional nuclease family protein [Collinsella tanakaei]
MIRVDIETIIMAAGPVPSVIVLRERGNDDASDAPLRALSIQTGSYEAAAIGRGVDGDDGSRPITHDLMVDTIRELGGKLERVEINRVDAPIFYATVVLADQDSHEKRVDARPSDALALAVRSNAPIYVEDDVMNRAGNVSYRGEEDSEKELERFDEFARSVSPDDF